MDDKQNVQCVEGEMVDNPVVVVRKTKLMNQTPAAKNKVNKVMTGELAVEKLSVSQAEELKRLLTEKGLTLDYLLQKYKDITSSVPESVKASDILKALESLMKFHGVGEEKTETSIKVGALLQAKSIDEIQQYFIELTQKTTKYLSGLKQKEQEQESDIP